MAVSSTAIRLEIYDMILDEVQGMIHLAPGHVTVIGNDNIYVCKQYKFDILIKMFSMLTLEALSVYDRRTRFIILFFANPHLLKG